MIKVVLIALILSSFYVLFFIELGLMGNNPRYQKFEKHSKIIHWGYFLSILAAFLIMPTIMKHL